MKKYPYVILFIWLITLFPLSGVHGTEFRVIKPILTPQAGLPEGAKPVSRIEPVNRKIVEGAVKKLMEAWNGNALEKMLGKEFYDKSRLDDAMDDKVPRDAKLRVLSIQGVQTLNQYIEDRDEKKSRVSTVSVTVRTQLEFNDPENGFQRREGTNEYVFRIKQRVRD